MDPLKCLSELGFSGYDARVLSALMSEGAIAAKPLSQKAGVPMGMIYATLGRLKSRGLVEEVPGKTRRFAAVDKDEVIRTIATASEKRREDEHAREVQLLSELGRGLGMRSSREVRMRYFSDEDEYWAAYLKADLAMGSADILRAILPVRPCNALLDWELRLHPGLAEVNRRTAHRRGPKFRYLTNVDALVSNTCRSLKDPREAAQSLGQILSHAKDSGDWFFKSKSMVKNMVVFIMKDRVFFEFYSGDCTEFIAALELNDERIVEDFSQWFDQLFGPVRDRKKALAVFEKRLIAAARKQGIRLAASK